jgi:tetratricopeptide (TPR) repeat protein
MVAAPGPARGSAAPLFGRDEVGVEIARLLDRAADGKGDGLLLFGRAGIGKTQVLRAVVERAERRGFTVLAGRALPQELPPPFTLLRELFRVSGRDAGPEGEAPNADRSLSLFLAPYGTAEEEPPTSPGFTGPASTPPDELEGLLSPFAGEMVEGASAGREALLTRLVEHAADLARTQPLLLAVDDLPFADSSSLDFFRRFASDWPRQPIAFVATAASPDAELPERTRRAIGSLERSPSIRRIDLRPMTVPEVGEFARWILGGREPDAADVLRWHAQTEGNPLFVEQLVRAASGIGALGRTAGDAASRDVTEILIAREHALGDADRRLLTYAAILGKEFEFPTLAAVAGTGEERVTESLDHLVRDGLLREKGGEVYEFVSEAVRLAVYGELTETRRRLLHRKAGRALAARPGAGDFELARQFYLGRDDDRAVEFNLRAAQSAARAFALETAIAHLARALEAQRRRVPPDERAELKILNEQGRLLDEIGDLKRSEEVLLEAIEHARARSDVDLELAHGLLGLAQTRADRAEYGSAMLLANEAAELLQRVGTPRDRMAAHRVRGTVAWRHGDLLEAQKQRQAALAIAETDGSPIEQGHALVDLANTMIPEGTARLDQALQLYARAGSLFATAENRSAQARVLMNTAVIEYGDGRVDAALDHLSRAIEAAEQSKSPIWISYCHLNLAQWSAELGRLPDARAALDRAVQAAGPLGDRLANQQIAMTRGMIAEGEGALDTAAAHFRDALRQAREMGMPAEIAEMELRLGHLASRRGDRTAAREGLRAALAAGIRDHRPDLGARIAELERAVAADEPHP